MQYNIHPIFVHFPVALLCFYSILKILPFKKWFPKVAWQDIEAILLLGGVLGAFAALYTGDIAEHLVRPERALVDMHSNFAYISTFLYGVLLLGELCHLLNIKVLSNNTSLVKIKSISSFLEKYFREGLVSKLVALIALVCIVVTGLLGGVMVYGLSADPFAGFVLKILGIASI